MSDTNNTPSMDTETTITFKRELLYHPEGGLNIAQMPLTKLLGIISSIYHNPKENPLDAIQALQKYGIFVHANYQHTNGAHMHGIVPSANTELPK